VLRLVLHAYEEACEMLAFVRDGDGDEPREHEIRRVLETLATFGFAEEYHYAGGRWRGRQKPKIEGWILWLLGVTGTDAMSPARVDRELANTDLEAKATAQYVPLAESRALPTGKGSLPEWLAQARATFAQLIDAERSR
jgi:hypothetical protein